MNILKEQEATGEMKSRISLKDLKSKCGQSKDQILSDVKIELDTIEKEVFLDKLNSSQSPPRERHREFKRNSPPSRYERSTNPNFDVSASSLSSSTFLGGPSGGEASALLLEQKSRELEDSQFLLAFMGKEMQAMKTQVGPSMLSWTVPQLFFLSFKYSHLPLFSTLF